MRMNLSCPSSSPFQRAYIAVPSDSPLANPTRFRPAVLCQKNADNVRFSTAMRTAGTDHRTSNCMSRQPHCKKTSCINPSPCSNEIYSIPNIVIPNGNQVYTVSKLRPAPLPEYAIIPTETQTRGFQPPREPNSGHTNHFINRTVGIYGTLHQLHPSYGQSMKKHQEMLQCAHSNDPTTTYKTRLNQPMRLSVMYSHPMGPNDPQPNTSKDPGKTRNIFKTGTTLNEVANAPCPVKATETRSIAAPSKAAAQDEHSTEIRNTGDYNAFYAEQGESNTSERQVDDPQSYTAQEEDNVDEASNDFSMQSVVQHAVQMSKKKPSGQRYNTRNRRQPMGFLKSSFLSSKVKMPSHYKNSSDTSFRGGCDSQNPSKRYKYYGGGKLAQRRCPRLNLRHSRKHNLRVLRHILDKHSKHIYSSNTQGSDFDSQPTLKRGICRKTTEMNKSGSSDGTGAWQPSFTEAAIPGELSLDSIRGWSPTETNEQDHGPRRTTSTQEWEQKKARKRNEEEEESVPETKRHLRWPDVDEVERRRSSGKRASDAKYSHQTRRRSWNKLVNKNTRQIPIHTERSLKLSERESGDSAKAFQECFWSLSLREIADENKSTESQSSATESPKQRQTIQIPGCLQTVRSRRSSYFLEAGDPTMGAEDATMSTMEDETTRSRIQSQPQDWKRAIHRFTKNLEEAIHKVIRQFQTDEEEFMPQSAVESTKASTFHGPTKCQRVRRNMDNESVKAQGSDEETRTASAKGSGETRTTKVSKPKGLMKKHGQRVPKDPEKRGQRKCQSPRV
ncbi:unnamed protein product [Cyprideis torosa]|uniref:Uncharacterized protein n=1 Tax=Cyprideis torosa TaxID=163714 RepID=A0A7R8ZRZ0_9CRUS|nr:unnamed protein product [Cyprideis torosa]CAG0894283.1 unnamed protein product [Cyprideis torosa]